MLKPSLKDLNIYLILGAVTPKTLKGRVTGRGSHIRQTVEV
jgi:hypothetical protein